MGGDASSNAMNSQSERDASSPGRPSANAAAAVAQLREALTLGDDQPIDADRAVEALAAMLPTFEAFDELAWGVLREIGQKGAVKQDEFRALLAGYLAKGDGAAHEVLRDRIHRLRILVAVLLSAVPKTPDFVNEIAEELSPEIIEEWVLSSRKVWKVWAAAAPDACWKRYRELVSRREAPGEALRRRILDHVANYDKGLRQPR